MYEATMGLQPEVGNVNCKLTRLLLITFHKQRCKPLLSFNNESIKKECSRFCSLFLPYYNVFNVYNVLTCSVKSVPSNYI